MDVLAIVLACSLHPDDALLRALVDVQSGGNPYFVGDLATLKTNDALTSAGVALQYAENLAKYGGKPAVGLLGVPLSWAGRYGRPSIDLFDPCTNVAVATAAFAEYAQDCARPSRAAHGLRAKRPRPARDARSSHGQRACILSHFAADLGVVGAPGAILRSLRPAADVVPRGRDGDPAQRSNVLGGVDTASTPDGQSDGLRLFFDSQPPAPSR